MTNGETRQASCAADRKDAEALGRHFAKTLRMKEDEEPPADSKKTRKKKPPSIPTPLREEKKGKSLDLRETIERLRREKNRAAKEEEFCDKEGHHCDETEEEKISSKNSETTPNGKQKGEERESVTPSAREQNDKTVTAEDLRKKMKDEGDDSAEALNTSQESMEKSMKKKREEGNEKKGAEEGPPGYTNQVFRLSRHKGKGRGKREGEEGVHVTVLAHFAERADDSTAVL